jgi:hypothetical protein
MDPTILAAKGALDGIKAGLEVGKKTEELMGDIMTFVNHSADVKFAANKKDSLRKMVSDSKTVEQEAVEVFMRKKAIEEMEDELREYVNKRYGSEAWNEIMHIQADIKKERRRLEWKRQLEKWASRGLLIGALTVLTMVVMHYR